MKTSSPTGYAETTVDTGGRCPLCAGAIKATAKVAYGVELSTRIGHKGEPIIAVTAKDVRVIHSALIPHKCVFVEDAPQVDEDHDLVEDIAEVISHAAPIDWDLSLERLDEDAADGLRHVARAIIERLRSQGRIEATR